MMDPIILAVWPSISILSCLLQLLLDSLAPVSEKCNCEGFLRHLRLIVIMRSSAAGCLECLD
jgi:hypothetical protein